MENVTAVKEKEMSNIKQNYEKKISTLENQLKDKDLKIEILTEERVDTSLHTYIFILFHTILKSVTRGK